MAMKPPRANIVDVLGDDPFIFSLSKFLGTRFPTRSSGCGDDSQVVGATRPCDLPLGPGMFKGGLPMRKRSESRALIFLVRHMRNPCDDELQKLRTQIAYQEETIGMLRDYDQSTSSAEEVLKRLKNPCPTL